MEGGREGRGREGGWREGGRVEGGREGGRKEEREGSGGMRRREKRDWRQSPPPYLPFYWFC